MTVSIPPHTPAVPAGGAGRLNLTENDRSVLRAMAIRGEDFGYMTFDTIASDSGVDRKAIRRVVRRLARGGYTEFAKGLWTEDGTPAGAGYAITDLGRIAVGSAAEPDMAALRSAFRTPSTDPQAVPTEGVASLSPSPVGAGRAS